MSEESTYHFTLASIVYTRLFLTYLSIMTSTSIFVIVHSLMPCLTQRVDALDIPSDTPCIRVFKLDMCL